MFLKTVYGSFLKDKLNGNKALLGLFLSSILSAPAFAASDDFCQSYAVQAVGQFETATEASCSNLAYPVWSEDFNHHYNWCRGASEEDAGSDGKKRADALAACTGTQSAVITGMTEVDSQAAICLNYANDAAAQQAQNQEMNCGLSGPAWNADVDAHKNWCVGLSDITVLASEDKKRADALNLCAGQGTISPAQPVNLPKTPTQGDRAFVPIPLPMPAFVPTPLPKPADIQLVAQQVTSAPSRATLVNALLADPIANAQLKEIPNLSGNLQNLAQQSLGSPGGGANSAQILPAGLNWNTGVHFSPLVQPPTYALGSKTPQLGTVAVAGAWFTYDMSTIMARDKVVFLHKGSGVELSVDLPNETATYMVAFGFNSLNAPMHRDVYSGYSPQITATEFASHIQNSMTLTPTTNGLIAILTIQKDDPRATGSVIPVLIGMRIDYKSTLIFGGVTVTKL